MVLSRLSKTELATIHEAAQAEREGAKVRWRITLRPRTLAVVIGRREGVVFTTYTAKSFRELLAEAEREYRAEVQRAMEKRNAAA